jgi:hypothetical protein
MRHVYAKVETNFLHDPRVMALTGGQFRVYLALWLMAVEYRTEVLTVQQSDPVYVARRSGESLRTVRLALGRCLAGDRPLLQRGLTGRITVCGVTKLHPRLFPGSCIGEERREYKEGEERTGHETEPGKAPSASLSGGNFQEAVEAWEKRYGPADQHVTDCLFAMFTQGGVERTVFAIKECAKKKRDTPIAFTRRVFNDSNHRDKRSSDLSTIGSILSEKRVVS